MAKENAQEELPLIELWQNLGYLFAGEPEDLALELAVKADMPANDVVKVLKLSSIHEITGDFSKNSQYVASSMLSHISKTHNEEQMRDMIEEIFIAEAGQSSVEYAKAQTVCEELVGKPMEVVNTISDRNNSNYQEIVTQRAANGIGNDMLKDVKPKHP